MRRETWSEKLVTTSEGQTQAFAETLAGSLRGSDVVYLIGDLGAGKTCFARGLARGLGASVKEVASPTFAIVHEYAGRRGEVVLRHLDLYRLKDTERELEVLGLPDSVAGAPAAVEWPNQAVRRLLPPTLEISIEVLPDGSRVVEAWRAAKEGSP